MPAFVCVLKCVRCMYVCMYMHVCMYVGVHIDMCVHMYAPSYVHECSGVVVCAFLCMCVCVCLCVCLVHACMCGVCDRTRLSSQNSRQVVSCEIKHAALGIGANGTMCLCEGTCTTWG